MANLPDTIANMAFGKGVYQGDVKFLMPDGSVMDKDGREISPASALGAAAYSGFSGYMPAYANIPAAQLPLATGAARAAGRIAVVFTATGTIRLLPRTGATRRFPS